MSQDDFFDENNLENGDGDLAEEESADCPICYDPLDITDLCFKPCPCGFQVRTGPAAAPFSFVGDPCRALRSASVQPVFL